MAREYQVKINVDSTKAEAALSKFEQKAQRTFDKLNKTSFQPTAFINGIHISINEIMKLAAKEQEAAAKISKAEADVAKAKEKTKQENAKARQESQKTAQAEIKAQAEVKKARAEARKEAEKTAQVEVSANAAVAKARAEARKEATKLREEEQKTAREAEKTAREEEKTAQVKKKANADVAKEKQKTLQQELKLQQQEEKTAQAEKRIIQERIKGMNQAYVTQQKVNAEYIKGQQANQREAEKTRQQELKLEQQQEKTAQKFIQSEQKKSSTARQGSNEIISSHQAVANNFTKVTGQMTNAWNQLKMIIGFAGVTGALRSAFNEMKAMSDELITYQKVTGASSEQVAKVRQSAYESAYRYGQTPSDFLASVAVMARAGYGEQSEAMADLATKTQLVGDMTSEAASQFLIAVDAGYQLKGNIEELTNVLDKANIIDNNYATSLSKVADAMTLIAPLSASMNVSIEETMAAIGTMSAVTQRQGTEVARAYRMIALNIAKDTETEVEEGVKLTEEEIKSLNDILQVYAATELKAADAAGKLLSPMKAIEAISRAWKSGALNEQELFKVLNGIGGARYTNSIMALVKNFDMYEDMLSKFVTEMGSADAEVDAMTKGWTAKFNQLKVAWTEMVNNAVSEDFIRQLLDISKGFIQWTGNLQTFSGVVGGTTITLKALKAVLTGTKTAFTGFGLAIGAVTLAISALNAASESRKRAAQQEAQAALDATKQEYEKARSIDELSRAYRQLAEDGTIDDTELDQARTIQQDINTLVGELPEKYNLVAGSIDKNVEALQRMNSEQRQAAYIRAQEAVNTSGRALVENGKDFMGVFTGLDTEPGTLKKEPYLESAFANSEYFRYGRYGASINPVVQYTGEKTAEQIVAAYDELCQIIDKATAADINSEGYHALIETRNQWTELITNYKDALEFLGLIKAGDFSKGTGGTAGGAGSGSTGTSGTDKETQSWDRLAKAIENATKAKKDFDTANETSKADQIKDYASVYATLAEELKNGRVNSTATHAALQMLLGDEAYAATGGKVTALQEAWTGKRAGQMLSAAESYEILTGTYQNQNGQTVEGAGIAVLAEKVGMEVRDELGNYMLDFTDTAKLEQLSALTGVTVDALRSALNAYDQYDITGTSTGAGHPQEQDGVKTPEETYADAIEGQTTATEANTEALNALTSAIGGDAPGPGGEAEDPFVAKALENGIASGTGTSGGNGRNLNPGSVDKGSREKIERMVRDGEAIVVEQPNGGAIVIPAGDAGDLSTANILSIINANEWRSMNHQFGGKTAFDYRGDPIAGEGLATKLQRESEELAAQYGVEPNAIPNETLTEKFIREYKEAAEEYGYFGVFGEILKTEAQGAAYIAQNAPEILDKLINGEITQSDSDRRLGHGPLPGTALAGEDKYLESESPFDTTAQPNGVGASVDAEGRAQETRDAVVETSADIGKIADQLEDASNEDLAYWRAMLNGAQTGDFSGYEGPYDIERAYKDYKQQYGEGVMDFIYDRIDEARGGGLTEDQKAISAAIEPIIDKYQLDDILSSLEYDLNDELKPIVIDTVLNKYSLEQVIGSLNLLTEENRTAVIQAAIAKYGRDAVIAELKKIATNNGGGWAAEIIAELEPSSKEEAKRQLRELTQASTKKIYTQVITSGGPYGVNATAHEAVGSSSYHGGSALVNDGTGAELVLDSHGAHVYGGGNPTVTNIERGAMIYTAEQTRSLIASVPHHATGNESNAAAQLAAELNAFFDYIRTGDTKYTLTGSASSGAGAGSSTKANADDQWKSLQELIEYIIKRLGKALEAQEKVIDEQINALQAQKSQRDEQSKIEELQKAVAEAQSNLAEAQSQRSVRYIDDNGQWHWMADQKKVQQAQEALDKANKSFVDYLYEASIDAQVKALEDEKTRLSDEYTGYKDLWSDILDAVATPTGDLVALIQYLTANGTGAQRNGATAVKEQLITAMLGGSYKANYNEALGEIGKAAANNPSVPGISDAALAALIASSGTSVSSGAMLGALQSIAGNNAVVGNIGGSTTNTDNSVQYFINGVQIGSNMANMPLSEILQRLSVYANASL